MFTYNGGGIAFGGKCCWNYNNDTARNVVIFGVDNSLLSDIDNPKSNFLVLGKEPTESVNSSVGTAEKNLVLTLVKQIQVYITTVMRVICM